MLLMKGSRYVLGDDTVSKQHFRIYSIIYEKEKLHDFPPLIYCEDLESTNGTYVNDVCIGIICRERMGHLLSNGDIIDIKPNIRFQFHQSIHHLELRTREQFADLEVSLAPCIVDVYADLQPAFQGSFRDLRSCSRPRGLWCSISGPGILNLQANGVQDHRLGRCC